MFKQLRIKFYKWQEKTIGEEMEACEWFIQQEPHNDYHNDALDDMRENLKSVRAKLNKLSPN